MAGRWTRRRRASCPSCSGRQTRLSSRIEELAKGYEAEVLLGTMTDTLDMDGTVLETRPTDGVTEEAVRAITSEFIGEIQQAPPMYSAVKHRGRAPLCDRAARRGGSARTARRDGLRHRRPIRLTASRANLGDVRSRDVRAVVGGGHRRAFGLWRRVGRPAARSRRPVQPTQLSRIG